MPITFRCPACRNKLSTAKRKAGSTVACPGCGGEVRVPTADEQLDPQVERLLTTAGAPAERSAEAPLPEPPAASPFDFREGASPAPKPTAKRAKPVTPSASGLNDLPLFEREDFAEMLEKQAESKPDEPLPLPTEPAQLTKPADGFVVTRGTAITVLVAVMVLLGLAFAAGFLVGRLN